MKNRIPEELLSSPLFLLKRLGMKAKEESYEAYTDAGVHPYPYASLATLAEGERETQGAIADALGYDRGQLVGLLDELEERKLIVRRRDPDDRRRHLVEMTTDGKRKLRRLRTLAAENEDHFLEPLTRAEREQLHALLLKLAEKHEPSCAPLTPR
jgi:DNA-binding MarR family transcriptional regulator